MRMPPKKTKTLIIGAGLAGLSTALHGQGDAIILEAESYVGGKARSEIIDGFTFDVTGHWLHLRDDGIRALVFKLLGKDHFHQIERISRIWSHGVYTRYPYQANVYGLPPEVIKDCIMGAIEADRSLPAEVALADEPENFADWIRFYFGEGIARHFMIPYNAKLWGVPATEITSRWCQRFVPRPRLEDIVAGAVGCNAKKMGYNASFYYPRAGGIQTLADALADAVGRGRIFHDQRVIHIDPARKTVRTASGEIQYERLINTMPLPAFIDALNEVPESVQAARSKLRATEVVYFNAGIKGALGQPDHWIYVPEETWPMYRVGSFSNAVPSSAPDGQSSLYIELSDRETPPEALIPKVTEGLIAMGLIKSAEQVLFMHPRRIKHAYVIYDFDYHQSRAEIHAWLGTQNLMSIGRYGDWNYSSMEDALIDGREAAQIIDEAPK